MARAFRARPMALLGSRRRRRSRSRAPTPDLAKRFRRSAERPKGVENPLPERRRVDSGAVGRDAFPGINAAATVAESKFASVATSDSQPLDRQARFLTSAPVRRRRVSLTALIFSPFPLVFPDKETNR